MGLFMSSRICPGQSTRICFDQKNGPGRQARGFKFRIQLTPVD
jgi:hypothetical protein